MNRFLPLMIVLTGVLATQADAGDMHSAGHHEQKASPHTAMSGTETPSTDGIIRKINHEAGMLTVEHGPIQNLGMAAMTMPYHVKDRAMLTAVRPGDKVRMSVEKLGELYTITALQRVQ